MWVFINGALVDLEKYSALIPRKLELANTVQLYGVTDINERHYITSFVTMEKAECALRDLAEQLNNPCDCKEKCQS